MTTRTIFLGTMPEPITQTPIPWCTTHDSYGYVRPKGLPDACQQAEAYGWEGLCVISTGGPDHRWWQDE